MEELLPSGKIRVQVDPTLLKLVPVYLQRRAKDVGLLTDLLEDKDFAGIQSIGHKLRGHAGTYGFNHLTEIGTNLESAAILSDSKTILDLTQKLARYLDVLEIAPEKTG